MNERHDNPFDARQIAPGARRFRFPPGSDRLAWWHQFEEVGFRGAIVGPHGVGKTTLLRELLRRCCDDPIDSMPADGADSCTRSTEERNRLRSLADQTSAAPLAIVAEPRSRFVRRLIPDEAGFQRGERSRLGEVLREIPAASWLIVDGFDALSRWDRWRLLRVAHRHGVPLTVTSHRTTSLPTLLGPRPSAELFFELVRESSGTECPWSDGELAALYAAHHGNLREALFELYDRWSIAKRSGESSSQRDSDPGGR